MGALPIKMLGGNEFRLRKVVCLRQTTLTARTGADGAERRLGALPIKMLARKHEGAHQFFIGTYSALVSFTRFAGKAEHCTDLPARSWQRSRQLQPREPARERLRRFDACYARGVFFRRTRRRKNRFDFISPLKRRNSARLSSGNRSREFIQTFCTAGRATAPPIRLSLK